MVELSSSFEIDEKMIDQDHRRMVEMVNAIIKAIDEGNPKTCQKLVPDFVAFAKQHFSREEALLATVRYPDTEKHREHHRTLNEKMEHILEFARMAENNEMARESLKKELVFFLMDDVITSDLEFKEYLSEKVPDGKNAAKDGS